MISFFKETKVDFVSKRRIGYVISLSLFLISLVYLIINRGPNYGIDFTGGTLIELRFSKKVRTEDIRKVLSELGEAKAEIQKMGKGYEYIIKVPPKEKLERGKGFSEIFISRLKKRIKGLEVDLRREETVGPRIGTELQRKAIYALLIGMIGILIYVGLRLDFRFGVGAVAALLHDAFITLGILTLLGKEITIAIVAALLTIIGYSVNDSIVVSVRVQEHMKLLRGRPIEDVVNAGVNATLGRTVITSLTTLFVALAIWIFGAPTIKDFGLTFVIGIVIGTYSSIFIVSNLVVEWEKLFPKKKKRR